VITPKAYSDAGRARGLRHSTKVAGCAAVLLGMVFAVPSSAHHSYAMFDLKRDAAVTGIVKEWQWTNPHAWLIAAATDEAGKTVEWRFESSAPAVLRTRGWGRSIMKPGDKVVVEYSPFKSGAPGGQLNTVTVGAGNFFTVGRVK
jgi:hypothetical protein